MTREEFERLVDEFGVACCMLYEECNATDAEALANIHACVPVSRSALLSAHSAQAAEVEGLRDALEGICKLYGNVWDRADGCLVIFPENVERFDAAFDKARAALSGVGACLSGGCLSTVTLIALNSMNAITQPTTTQTDANESCSAAPERRSYSGRGG